MEVPIDVRSLGISHLPVSFSFQGAEPVSNHNGSVLEALMLALNDSSVFAAAVGPRTSGKTQMFKTVVESARAANKICLSISSPNTITSDTVKNMSVALQAAINQTSALSIKVVFAIDDAHKATEPLFQMLTGIATQRHLTVTSQVILFGLPSLWTRLKPFDYEALERRIAVRCTLQGFTSPDQPIYPAHMSVPSG